MFRRIAVVVSVAALALVGAGVPAQAADEVPLCSNTGPGEYPNGQDSTSFIRCEQGLPHVKQCPLNVDGTRLVFNTMLRVCDPVPPSPVSTTLTAGGATVSLLPLGVQNLNATLTYSAGTPVMNGTITFISKNGRVLCSATTDGNGHASCDASGLLSTVDELLRGYTAIYSGNAAAGSPATFSSSTGHGTVSLL